MQKNAAWYFDPDNAISRAASANISDTELAVKEIAAIDKANGDIVIKVDKVLSHRSA